jgi:hypothetical protein
LKTEKGWPDYNLDGYPVDLDSLFRITVERNASDLHLICGAPPHIRVNGDLICLEIPRCVEIITCSRRASSPSLSYLYNRLKHYP